MGLIFGRQKQAEERRDLAIAFNDKGDGLSDIDLRTGTLVLGAPGSGKTAFVGALYRKMFLTRGYGGIVLTVKRGEAADWIAAAKAYGREKDIIHVTKGGLPFDPLTHEMRRGGDGCGDTTNIVDILTTLCDVGRPHVTSNGDDASRFFRESTEQAERAGVNLLKAAGEPVSLLNIRSVLNSLPDMPVPEEPSAHTPETKEWLAKSFAGKLLSRIAERRNANQLTDDDWRAAEYAADFLCNEWPALAPETRTSIKQTFSSMADKLLSPPFDRMLCSGKCAYVPEQTYIEGKIIIFDLPIVEYGKSAELLQIANKLVFQKAIQRKDKDRYPRQVFLWADEFQNFCIKQDADFQEICRESGGCVWYATQNLQNIARRLHEHQPGSGTLGLISNIGVRIFLQNGETEFTNRWSAECFGKNYDRVVDGGAGGVHWREQERYLIHPKEFIRLRVPGKDFPYAVGVVYRNGQLWKETGEPYLIYGFPRV
jgi:hypothetical protein